MQALGLVWSDVDSRAPDYRERAVRIDAPKHSGARLTLAVWRRCVASDGFVVGRDIPSRDLSNVLRNLAIYEPVEESRDFRIRIAGTAFYRRFGRDITGERLSNLFEPEAFERRRASLTHLIGNGAPYIFEVERVQGSRMPMLFELLLLPVLASDRVTRWAMGGIFFQDWVS